MSRILLPIGLAVLAGAAACAALLGIAELYTVINVAIYVSVSVYALSLALLWGVGGILCFGQSAFFGLGAYAYAITAINLGDTTGGLLTAVIVPVLFAAALGYFLFYGRLSDVYLGVITLTITLILFKLINSTGDASWRIGHVPIGGFNGIPDTPTLNMPFNPDAPLTPQQILVVSMAVLVLVYAFCKALTATRFGRAVAAVRENETRAELLGYDARLLKLAIFCIAAGIAGLSGALFATSVFVSPTVFGLGNAAQVLIWVVVGGVGTFVGPILSCIALQWLTTWLGTLGSVDPNIVLGVILLGFVLIVPRGVMPVLIDGWQNLADRWAGGTRAVGEALEGPAHD